MRLSITNMLLFNRPRCLSLEPNTRLQEPSFQAALSHLSILSLHPRLLVSHRCGLLSLWVSCAFLLWAPSWDTWLKSGRSVSTTVVIIRYLQCGHREAWSRALRLGSLTSRCCSAEPQRGQGGEEPNSHPEADGRRILPARVCSLF